MQQLFSPDSKVMRAMNRATDLLILNLLFLISCIPIVTFGAAITALYAAVMCIGTVREDSPIKTYFRSFRDNFFPALKVWLVIVAVAGALILDIVLCFRLGGNFVYALIPFCILLAVWVLTAGIAFPLLSLFGNSTLGTLKNSLILSLANLPRAVVVAVLWLFPFWLILREPLVFFNAVFILVVIYFSAAAYLSVLVLRKVFRPYLPEEFTEEEAE